MKLIFIVGMGSFLGGISRYLLSSIVQHKSDSGFPYGTLAVNLFGCFVIGCLFGLSERLQLSLQWRLFLMTGILGGFTTFSAFSLETFQLLKGGQTGLALIYLAASLLFGIALTFLGAWVCRA